MYETEKITGQNVIFFNEEKYLCSNGSFNGARMESCCFTFDYATCSLFYFREIISIANRNNNLLFFLLCFTYLSASTLC